MLNWVSWMLDSNSRFLPSISFNKKSQLFSLYFYQDKGAYLSKVFFEWDGGDFLPTLNDFFIVRSFGSDSGSRVAPSPEILDFISIIIDFFSFNKTSLSRAIHSRRNSKVVLTPKVAALKKHFFGQLQVRASSRRHSLTYEQFKSFVLLDGNEVLLSFVKQAAASYDLSCFTEFFSAFKENSGFAISFDKAYSLFSKLVLDFQR